MSWPYPAEGHSGCSQGWVMMRKADLRATGRSLCGYSLQVLWVNPEACDHWVVWGAYA